MSSDLMKKYIDMITESINDEVGVNLQKDYFEIKDIHIPKVKNALNVIDNCISAKNIQIDKERLLNAIMKAEWHLAGIRMKAGLPGPGEE